CPRHCDRKPARCRRRLGFHHAHGHSAAAHRLLACPPCRIRLALRTDSLVARSIRPRRRLLAAGGGDTDTDGDNGRGGRTRRQGAACALLALPSMVDGPWLAGLHRLRRDLFSDGGEARALGAADAAHDAPGAAAIGAGLALGERAAAAALRADVLARPGSARAGLVARVQGRLRGLRHQLSSPSPAISPISSSLRWRICSPSSSRSRSAFFAWGNISSSSSFTWCFTYSPSTVKVA